MMSAVVYDVGYDTRVFKKRRNMVTVRLLAALKEKYSQDRSPKIYQDFGAHCHIISSEYQTTSYHTADRLSSDHGINLLLETFLRFYIFQCNFT